MKPRLIALNLLLLVGIGTSLWLGRARWQDAEAQRRGTLDVKVPRVTPPPVSPAPVPEAPPATKYVDVATQDLFSKDRNPTVIIEPPKPEKVREMPSLPVVYGVLGLPSGVKALMAEKPGLSTKSVHAGDTIGEFTIAALDPRSVTFVWEGKEVQKPIEDLMDRTNRAAASSQASNPAPQALPLNAPQVGVPTQVQQPQGANTPPPQNNPSGAVIGAEMGAPGHSERGCRPGDNSPAGAVVEGYKKSIDIDPLRHQLPLGSGAVVRTRKR